MLVRTTKRIAGFPPPGRVGEVDDERGALAVERGEAEDMSSLSTRLRRPSPEPTVIGGGELPPSPGPREPAPSQSAPSGDAPVTYTLPDIDTEVTDNA